MAFQTLQFFSRPQVPQLERFVAGPAGHRRAVRRHGAARDKVVMADQGILEADFGEKFETHEDHVTIDFQKAAVNVGSATAGLQPHTNDHGEGAMILALIQARPPALFLQ